LNLWLPARSDLRALPVYRSLWFAVPVALRISRILAYDPP
jgi:hypothetical protein